MRLRPSYSQFNIMNSQEQMGVYKEMTADWIVLLLVHFVLPQVVSGGKMLPISSTATTQARASLVLPTQRMHECLPA